MKRTLALVTVVVDDYDRAIAHYTNDLGFVLLEDTPLGGGKRWVRVAPHADDATATNFDTSLFEKSDGAQPILEAMRGAMLGKEAPRALQVMSVTGQARLFQTVGNFLTFNEPEGGIRSDFAISCHFPDAVAHFV